MGRNRIIIFVMTISSLVMVTMIPCVDAVKFKDHHKPHLFKVGNSDENGWRAEMNYEVWGSEQDFYVGDWLYFNYNRTLYSVLVVNETDHNTCRTESPIANITSGTGRDLFNLTSIQTYYFISGGGYCNRGMKLAVKAKFFTGFYSPPTPTLKTRFDPFPFYRPPPPKIHRPPSPSGRRSAITISLVASVVVLSIVFTIVIGGLIFCW